MSIIYWLFFSKTKDRPHLYSFSHTHTKKWPNFFFKRVSKFADSWPEIQSLPRNNLLFIQSSNSLHEPWFSKTLEHLLNFSTCVTDLLGRNAILFTCCVKQKFHCLASVFHSPSLCGGLRFYEWKCISLTVDTLLFLTSY